MQVRGRSCRTKGQWGHHTSLRRLYDKKFKTSRKNKNGGVMVPVSFCLLQISLFRFVFIYLDFPQTTCTFFTAFMKKAVGCEQNLFFFICHNYLRNTLSTANFCYRSKPQDIFLLHHHHHYCYYVMIILLFKYVYYNVFDY